MLRAAASAVLRVHHLGVEEVKRRRAEGNGRAMRKAVGIHDFDGVVELAGGGLKGRGQVIADAVEGVAGASAVRCVECSVMRVLAGGRANPDLDQRTKSIVAK